MMMVKTQSKTAKLRGDKLGEKKDRDSTESDMVVSDPGGCK